MCNIEPNNEISKQNPIKVIDKHDNIEILDKKRFKMTGNYESNEMSVKINVDEKSAMVHVEADSFDSIIGLVRNILTVLLRLKKK